MLMIGQDEVFGWADDYFGLNQKQEKEKVKEAEKLMRPVSECFRLRRELPRPAPHGEALL